MSEMSGYTDKFMDRGDDPLNRFIHGTITWKKSREEVWEEVLVLLDQKDEKKVQRLIPAWMRYAAAAGIVVMLGITAFMRFYSKSFSTEAGTQMEIMFPDGSKSSLNAGTSLKYFPLWWKFSRIVEMEGEAFFLVNEGKKFEIISERGKTFVVGTSFNVLSADGTYEVTCVSGIVKVVSVCSGDEVIITQNQKAMIGGEGHLEVKTQADIKESTAWTRGEFAFTSVPLENVFKKLETSYGISIQYTKKDNLIYTGYFKRDKSVENILNLVCIPFGIKFEETSDGVYQITQNE